VSCVFCGPVSAAYEDDVCRVILHEDGHPMIVARRHVENVSDLAPEEWAQFAKVWHHTERELLKQTGAERAIILKLGIQTPHLHVHLYAARANEDRAAVFAKFR
jgi:diadenosine tetraphosphate (Ap4A) HIT family hydrolase